MQGALLLKHGRHGKPKVHFFRLASCDTLLRWRGASGSVKQVLLSTRRSNQENSTLLEPRSAGPCSARPLRCSSRPPGCIVAPAPASRLRRGGANAWPTACPPQVRLRNVSEVVAGQTTEVFRRCPLRPSARCFSLRYRDEDGTSRTLDLTCADEQQYELWLTGLRVVAERLRTLGTPVAGAAGTTGRAGSAAGGSLLAGSVGGASASAAAGAGAPAGGLSPAELSKCVAGSRALQVSAAGTRGRCRPRSCCRAASCLAGCPSRPAGACRAAPHALCCPRLFRAGGCPLRPALQRLASGPVVVPAAERTPCDLLAWGSAQRAPPVAPSLRSVMGVSDECWQRRSLPGLAPAGQQLDAYRAAVGRKHAAVVTATGAVYAWGEGRGGKLGLGHDQDQPLPQRVRHGLEGRVVTAVACGDDCTAALTEGGELFMWGRLHADSPPQLVPLHVRGGLRGRKVTQVRGAAGRGSVMPARVSP